MWKKAKLILKHATNHWVFVLLSLLVLAAILSYALSIGQGVWFDEGYSIFVAQQPLSKLIALVSVDAHPPAYYIILKLWGMLWNWNELALRALSIIFATAAIAFAFFIIKKLSNTKTALLTLPFLVLAPFALRYSYEIRPYAMASLIVTAATFVMLLAKDSKKYTYWAIYAIFVALGMLTLYMSAAVWIGHALWLTFYSWRDKKQFPAKPWLLSYFMSVVLFLPWLPTFFVQYTNSALPGIGQPMNLSALSETINHLLLYLPGWQIGEILTIFIIILFALFAILTIRIWDKNDKNKSDLIFMAFLTIVPFGVLMLLNTLSSDKFYISRYIAHFAIFYYMLQGYVIVTGYKYTPKTGLTAGVIVLALLSMGTINLATIGNYNFERSQKPAMHEFAKTLNFQNDATVIAQDEYTYLDSFYYLSSCNLKFLKEGEVSTRGGYAPLHASKNQLQKIADVPTPKIIFISWKDKDNSSLFDNSGFHKTRSELYEKHSIEYYEK